MTTQLSLKHLSVTLDGKAIISDVSFSLESGHIGCLLGASGCGKTTLLRTIAGFEQPTQGEVMLHGRLLARPGTSVPPEKRRIGMLFQDLALFPHLTVEDNIAFGLRGLERKAIQARVDELLKIVELSHLRKRHPHQLSGGQQQRIALIRALAPRPDLLLLDEPFSSQDSERREQLAREVGEIIRHDKITALLVTHDQFEAFAMADTIGVMGNGKLLQWDEAYNIYHCPSDRYVADFIGQGVFIKGRIISSSRVETEIGTVSGRLSQDLPVGTPVDLLVRPDDIIHDDSSTSTGRVLEKAFRGAEYRYTIHLKGGTKVYCLAPSHHNHAIGEAIGIRLKLDHLVVFPTDGE